MRRRKIPLQRAIAKWFDFFLGHSFFFLGLPLVDKIKTIAYPPSVLWGINELQFHAELPWEQGEMSRVRSAAAEES